MPKVSVILNATEAATGKKLQKTLTDINDSASSEQIKTFTTALNRLTTNNYIETNRVAKTNVDTEEVPTGGKKAPTFTVGERYEGDHFAACFPLTYDGDGTVQAVAAVGSQGSIRTYNGTYADNVVTFNSIGSETIAVLTITATETENYGSAGITITNSAPPQ